MHSALGRLVAATASFIAAAGTLTNTQSPAGQAPATFRSATDVVTIQASVRDSRGRVVGGLTPSDFEVRDNGQLRPILELRADLRSPITLAILVDMSGSMNVGPKIALARQAFDAVLKQFRPGEDEAALFTFDSALHERHGFTSDPAELRAALDEFEPFGTTSLYDATEAAARRLAERSATHRAVVVLTDGTDTSSRLTAAEVSGLAASIDVPVFVVATVPSVDQRAMMESSTREPRGDTADLRDLAEWTGGKLVFTTTSIETIVVASGIVNEVRHQYVLAIEAAAEREWRRLDIRVKHPSTTVKARSGYFGG